MACTLWIPLRGQLLVVIEAAVMVLLGGSGSGTELREVVGILDAGARQMVGGKLRSVSSRQQGTVQASLQSILVENV